MKQKKAVTSVIAMAFFIIIAVVAVSTLQLWLKNYSSGLAVDTENKKINLIFESFDRNNLYIKSSREDTMTVFRINDESGNLVCDLTGISSPDLIEGRNIISLSGCSGQPFPDKTAYSIVIFTPESSLAVDRYLR